MTTPARVSPRLTEVAPSPHNEVASKWMGLLGLVCVVTMAFGLGAAVWNARTAESAGPQALAAVEHVNYTLERIAASDWEAALETFDQGCTNFGLAEFQAAFGPVFRSYTGHSLTPPQNEPFEPDQIVLVRGTIDLGTRSGNTIRAELRFGGTDPVPKWRLCGLRIDEG
jgi:hypothetical protein